MNEGRPISAYKPNGELIGTFESVNLSTRKLYINNCKNQALKYVCHKYKNGERRLFYSNLLKTELYFEEAKDKDLPNIIRRYSRYTFNKQRTIR